MLDSNKPLVYLIIAAGDFYGEIPKNYDCVIAVDGGLGHCEKLGIKPDLIAGDFDSLGYVPSGENVIRLEPVKNQTDTDYVFHYFMDKLYSMNQKYMIHIFGATGGRFSHTNANIQSLSVFSYCTDITAYLYDKTETITCITSNSISFDKRKKGYISVLAMSDSAVVSITGLKYPLSFKKIKNTVPLGTSNEFINKPAQVTVHSGRVLILWER